MKKNRQNQGQMSDRSTGGTGSGTARDREMGRGGEPLGDRGRGNETWTPPAGEQGISNRPDDEAIDTTRAQGRTSELEDAEFEETDEFEEDEGDGFEDDDDESSGRPA
jgi:hypothetical protein